jgi:hypothetical protein
MFHERGLKSVAYTRILRFHAPADSVQGWCSGLRGPQGREGSHTRFYRLID